MTYTVHKSQICTIRQENPNFMIKDGFVVVPRAGFEISNKCPKQYKSIIMEAVKNGWLQPVANITERELLFIGLTNE